MKLQIPHTPFSFLTTALNYWDSAAPLVIGRVLMFVLWSFGLAVIHRADPRFDLNMSVSPFQAAGAVLGLLLVLRTNGGYERWWEGRKLWGAIVNATRSLAVSASAFGPDNPAWKALVARRIATFAHVCRRSLRDERNLPEIAALLGEEEARRLATCDHMPTVASRDLAEVLRFGLGDFQFLQADTLRSQLMDNLGGCERINKSPLPLAYAIEVRRFIFVFLATLPFVFLDEIPKQQVLWAVPLAMLLVSFPFLAIDKIGYELQHPFETHRLNHLPLDEITTMIERNVLALLDPHGIPADDGRLVSDNPHIPSTKRLSR